MPEEDQEARPIGERYIRATCNVEVGFVKQCGRTERLRSALPEIVFGQAMQLIVQRGKQLVRGLLVTSVGLVDQLLDSSFHSTRPRSGTEICMSPPFGPERWASGGGAELHNGERASV